MLRVLRTTTGAADTLECPFGSALLTIQGSATTVGGAIAANLSQRRCTSTHRAGNRIVVHFIDLALLFYHSFCHKFQIDTQGHHANHSDHVSCGRGNFLLVSIGKQSPNKCLRVACRKFHILLFNQRTEVDFTKRLGVFFAQSPLVANVFAKAIAYRRKTTFLDFRRGKREHGAISHPGFFQLLARRNRIVLFSGSWAFRPAIHIVP